ncbi:acyltransferase [Arthrobacter sp. NPDC056886]|uniref:acyltransferase n=1 Tax=Arthrobacter sp. NPDC056886 TaxID=3345960 RepID=UPI00366D061D
MSVILRGQEITGYSDDKGNVVVGDPHLLASSSIEFKGSNCRVEFADKVKFHGAIVFHRDDSDVKMGKWTWYRGRVTLGLGCSISMGEKFYSGYDLQITAAEGANVILGDDVLVANHCRIRADDSHPIYDGISGRRINASATIVVEDHVWLGQEVFLLPGAFVGSGSVVGARSVVTKSRPVPSNCLALGSPAKVQREKINWIRTHLQMTDQPDVVPSIFSGDDFIDSQRSFRQRLSAAIVEFRR